MVTLEELDAEVPFFTQLQERTGPITLAWHPDGTACCPHILRKLAVENVCVA